MLRCRACGADIEAPVFPGAHVRCACGADNVVPAPDDLAAQGPYRQAAAQPHAPASAPIPTAPSMTSPSSHGLGPLCPRCTRLLRDDDAETALVCDQCGGRLIDHALLGARVQAERPSQRPEAPPAHAPHEGVKPPSGALARCPECDEVMTPMNFGRRSGIVVDVCRDHGTWFDRGELEAVLAFVRAGGIEGEMPAPAGPLDPELRAAQARFTVAMALDEHRFEQDTRDLVQHLICTQHRRGTWAEQRERRRIARWSRDR